MSIVVTEAVSSRRYSEDKKGGSLERVFWVSGTDDPDTAVEHDDIPKIDDTWGAFDNLLVTKRSCEVEKCTGTEDEGLCKVTVVYERPDPITPPPPEGEDEFEISFMTQGENIKKAIFQAHYPANKDCGDYIGVDGENVEGVDINVPKITFREVHERGTLSWQYRRVLANLAGTINKFKFKGLEKGEVLFLGATARRTGTGPWRIEYMFACERNATLEIQTQSGTQTIEKIGWDYIWFQRAKVDKGVDAPIRYEVESAHVAMVYEWGDFKLLGIGE